MEYPYSYTQLKGKDRFFVNCYLNETLVEPQTHKHTFNDKLISYIFAHNIDVSEFMSFRYDIQNSFGQMITQNDYTANSVVTVTITNAKLYWSVLAKSTASYNKCLKAINDIRVLMYESEDKSKVLELKDAIVTSALSATDFKDRNDNRKMAMKLFGLDQVKVDMDVDMYTASGKQIFQDLHKNASDREDAPIIPDVIEDIDLSEDENEGNDK